MLTQMLVNANSKVQKASNESSKNRSVQAVDMCELSWATELRF